MSESNDMEAAVTRRDMQNAFELWSKALMDKMEAIVTTSERRMLSAMSLLEVRVTSAMHDLEARLLSELARATRASEEELTSRVSVFDDKYRDLPDRVARLEAKVFSAPKRKRR
jgi:hypothetical protein